MSYKSNYGNISCGEVLLHLADFIEDDIDEDIKEKIIAHLKECTWCEQFGTAYQKTVIALKNQNINIEQADFVEKLKQRLSITG
ncbi:MAG: hypothetical protein JXR91_16645 [Deltaproteobacteria bacterium]|nr:hypothetical protein [Deltaproteobacteria bacterium]